MHRSSRNIAAFFVIGRADGRCGVLWELFKVHIRVKSERSGKIYHHKM